MKTGEHRQDQFLSQPGRKRASILVGLLWCVVVLALVVVTILHTATIDLKITKNYGDKIQAHYLALAGIEKAKALLYQSRQAPSGIRRELYDAPAQFKEVQFGRGQFSVIRRAGREEGGGIFYGVFDEESRLNLNTARAEDLVKLDGLSAPMAADILAWRGEVGPGNPGGANADYYASLQPPSLPRNGRFETIRELLMVRGIAPDLVFGRDTHQNGFLPAPEENESGYSDRMSIDEDTGWSSFLTVDSSAANVNASGVSRVNIKTADESSLSTVNGITSAIARAIVQYRQQHQFQSIADLLDVTPPQNQGGNRNQRPPSAAANANDNSSGGPQVIDENLLLQIADDITADDSQNTAGLININTASVETLLCLPNMDRDRAQAIVNNTRSQGWFPNIAWLLRVPGMDKDLFKNIAPRVCTRSETFRIVTEGRVKSTGVTQRIQAIVHVDRDKITTVSYREDDL